MIFRTSAEYSESPAISERGGVLSAMDAKYQRGKIQEESLCYEHKKHDGWLPQVGVNTILPKERAGDITTTIELIRSTEEERGSRLRMSRPSRRTAIRSSPPPLAGRGPG